MSRPRLPPKHNERSYIIRQLSFLIDRDGRTLAEIADQAGYTAAQIGELRLCRAAKGGTLKRPLYFYEDVAEALGYKLRLERKDD